MVGKPKQKPSTPSDFDSLAWPKITESDTPHERGFKNHILQMGSLLGYARIGQSIDQARQAKRDATTSKPKPIILNKAALQLSVNGGRPHEITDRQFELFATLGSAKPGELVRPAGFTFPAARIKASLKPALKKLIESKRGGYRIHSNYEVVVRPTKSRNVRPL